MFLWSSDLNLSFSEESQAAGIIGPLTYEKWSHWKDNLWKLFLVAIAVCSSLLLESHYSSSH